MLKREYSILVVEDEEDFRIFLTILLKKMGAKVHAVTNVVEAFDHLTGKDKPELIISDFNLPGASGLELIDALKESGYGMPVILISAVKSFDKKALAKHGVAAFLSKPFSGEQLEAAIHASLVAE